MVLSINNTSSSVTILPTETQEVKKARDFLFSCNPQFIESGATFTFETIDAMEAGHKWHPSLVTKVTNAALVVFGNTNREKRAEIVRKTAEALEKAYIDKSMGALMAKRITENFAAGKYEAFLNPVDFKNALLNDLKSVFEENGRPIDKHLGMTWSFNPLPQDSPDRQLRSLSKDEELKVDYKTRFKDDEKINFGIEKVKILEGTNIGYLNIIGFSPMYKEARDVITDAMRKLAQTDALIIDLRENRGGSPAGVAFLASALFDQKTLLSIVSCRYDEENYCQKPIEYSADPSTIPQDAHFGGNKKVYLLTSSQTFSAGEAFAYALKTHGRGEVIGEEKTEGGANPTRPYFLDDHFILSIPTETAIDPITKSNWEGVGVTPNPGLTISSGQDALSIAITTYNNQK